MQEKNSAKSPYISTSKGKDIPFFPKISKAKPAIASFTPSKVIEAKPIAKSIFKETQEKNLFLPLEIDPNRIIYQKQYKELEMQLEKMSAKFKEQLDEIEEKKLKCTERIKVQHKRAYEKKYELWELRNQIMGLEARIAEEEEEEARMMQELGFGRLDEDLQEEDAEDQGQQQYQ